MCVFCLQILCAELRARPYFGEAPLIAEALDKEMKIEDETVDVVDTTSDGNGSATDVLPGACAHGTVLSDIIVEGAAATKAAPIDHSFGPHNLTLGKSVIKAVNAVARCYFLGYIRTLPLNSSPFKCTCMNGGFQVACSALWRRNTTKKIRRFCTKLSEFPTPALCVGHSTACILRWTCARYSVL